MWVTAFTNNNTFTLTPPLHKAEDKGCSRVLHLWCGVTLLSYLTSMCRLLVLIVWLIKSLAGKQSSCSLFTPPGLHSWFDEGFVFLFFFYTHGSHTHTHTHGCCQLFPGAWGDAGWRTRSMMTDQRHMINSNWTEDGWVVSGLSEWTGWWRGAAPLTAGSSSCPSNSAGITLWPWAALYNRLALD